MGHYAFLFANTALIVACGAMAIVFLALPLPPGKGLSKYRVSLRFLAGAYLIIATIELLAMIFDLSMVNLIPIDVLTIAAVQAPLFAYALITLLNPEFLTNKSLYRQLLIVAILNILYVLVSIRWDNPRVVNFTELKELVWHPAMMIREVFLLFYIFQLIYLTRLFFNQIRYYEEQINNYYADSSALHLSWVRYSFYAALLTGILTLLLCFNQSAQIAFIFAVYYGIYYLVFGVYYIQYPNTFVYIEPVIYAEDIVPEKQAKSNKRLMWAELKKQIITEKYYLRSGVNIEEMAQYLKVGRTTLSTFINNEEGMNFNVWINSLRVEESKSLLINHPEYSLAQSSELVGYSEPSNFSRQFKLITNQSPSVWRQSYQSESTNNNFDKKACL